MNLKKIKQWKNVSQNKDCRYVLSHDLSNVMTGRGGRECNLDKNLWLNWNKFYWYAFKNLIFQHRNNVKYYQMQKQDVPKI